MKFKDHIKLSLSFGFLVGLLIAIIDIISRIIVWSFQWFEFYQIIFTSVLITMSLFFIFSILAEGVIKSFNIKVNVNSFHTLYFSISTFFLLLFYGLIIVNIFIFSSTTLRDFVPLSWSIIVLLFSVVVFVALLYHGKNFASKLISYIKKRKILGNLLFVIVVFVFVSFATDIFLSSSGYTPLHESSITGEYPNIILITLDTTRADHMSLYGYSLTTTPNLDNLAKESVVFDNAVSTSSWTLPSHASIFTGKYPYNHKATGINQELSLNEENIAEILSKKGYATAGFVAGPFVKARYGLGQGFSFYNDRLDFFENIQSFDDINLRRFFVLLFPKIDKFIFRTDGERTAEEINKDVFQWLEKNKDQKFFLFLNYFDPHAPYNLGEEYLPMFSEKTEYDSEVESLFNVKRNAEVSEELVEFSKELYDAELFYLDTQLKNLFDKLDELGIKEETLLIITSDHGEEFYEHGGFTHAETLYEEVIHVPLIIYYPKEFSPRRVEERVSNIHIFSTILDIIDSEQPNGIDSFSLVPLMNGENSDNDYVLSELFSRTNAGFVETFQQAISKGNWKLISITPTDAVLLPSLFNLNNDPTEKENLYEINADKRTELNNYLFNLSITYDINYVN